MNQINYQLYVDIEGIRPFLYGEYTCKQEVDRAKKQAFKDANGNIAFVVFRKDGAGNWVEWF